MQNQEIDFQIGPLIGSWLTMSAVFSALGAGWIVHFVSTPAPFPRLIAQFEVELHVIDHLDLLLLGKLLSNDFLSAESLILIGDHFLIMPHHRSLVVEHGLMVNKAQIETDFQHLLTALTGAWQCQFLANSPLSDNYCVDTVFLPMMAEILASSDQLLHWLSERRLGAI